MRGRGHDPLRAVVIGAGVGGSAAALLLARAGLATTLVEKNRSLGGSCAAYARHGFKVDIGTHMFCRGDAGPLGEVLRRAGAPGAIEFRRTRDIAELRVAGGDGLVQIPVPASAARWPVFLLQIARAMRLSPREVAGLGRLFGQILSMPEAEIPRWDDRTVEDLVAPHTENGPTLALLGFLLGLYFVVPYWEVSAGEAIWCFRRMVRDNALSYPKGGAVAVPETYVRLARGCGAQVLTGTGVSRVRLTGPAGARRVLGVELLDGRFLPADVVISTSSVRTTVERLVGPAHLPEDYVARARRLRGSHIAVQVKIGLKRPLVSAGALVGGVGERRGLLDMTPADFKRVFQSVVEGRVPEVVPFYCPVPTNFDPGLAPPGCQLLTACAVAPTTDVALSDPAPAWEAALLRALERVVPGVLDDAVFVDRFSTRFIEHWIGKADGPAISTAQIPGQVGAGRPPVHTPIGGLYMAGCGAGARGVGTELAAASAMECVDRILADLGRLTRSERPGRFRARLRRRMMRAALVPVAWASRGRDAGRLSASSADRTLPE
jgi:phytoene dehydrogenase-like protein